MNELRGVAGSSRGRIRLVGYLERWGPWLLFAALLRYAWPINPFTTLQGYGDILEYIWGLEWYWTTLTSHTGSPLYTPNIFYPGGWHTATQSLTPSLFLAGLPLRALAGPAFAHNALVMLGYAVAFAGAQRFARLYTSLWPATVAALVYAFMPARVLQGIGHLHTFGVTAFLPWLLLGLERLRRDETGGWRGPVVAGLAWGAMINCGLYGVFIGALGLTLWGRDLLKPRRWGQTLVIGGVALLVGGPVIWLYYSAVREDGIHALSLWDPQHWAASLNSLTIPSVYHEWPVVRQFARSLYQGRVDEAVGSNFGLVTLVLAAVGLWRARTTPGRLNLVLLTAVSFVAALGLWLKWDGQEVVVPWLAPLNAWLWSIGHQFKPALFPTPTPPPEYANGIPLPGLVLTVLVPFWESARTTTRHAYVGGLSLVVLAAIGLRTVPRPAQALLALLWLVEALPLRGDVTPLLPTLPPHPAYTWLAAHASPPDAPILEMSYPNLLATGGEVSMGTLLHGHPNAGGAGTFWPAHGHHLQDALFPPDVLSAPQTALVLHQNGIRYILVQLQDEGARGYWRTLGQNPLLRPVGCFDPLPEPTPWWYPICITQVTPGPVPGYNLTRGRGWSDVESWGVWAEGIQAEATWTVLSQQPFELALAATPVCLSNRTQTVHLTVNGQPLTTHTWTGCEEWRERVVIPAALLCSGTNTLALQFAFAAPPVDPKTGQVVELRQLSVAFSQLQVRPLPRYAPGQAE